MHIVLGAGGAFGWAWHVGVLDAIDEQFDMTLADADQVIGTSAGAVIAMTRLAGTDTAATLDTVLARPDATIRADQRLRHAQAPGWRRWLSPTAPGLLVRPGPLAGAPAWVGLLPPGVFTTASLRRFPAPAQWPDNLLIVAVSLARGRRVVWGLGHDRAAPHEAIEASAAVPLLFEPKMIGGVAHVDGAVASPTSADLVTVEADSVVVVSNPMNRSGGRRVVRWWARRKTAGEVARLRAAGATVVVIEPDDSVVASALGYPRDNPGAGVGVAAAARRIATEAIRAAGLGSASA